MILALKGNLRNLTGRALRLVARDGREILTLQPDGQIVVEWAEEYLGSFNGYLDLGYRVATSMTGFPPDLPSSYYVVDAEVVLAALHLKRPIKHLLVPIGRLYYKDHPQQKRLPSYQRLMPAEYWLDAEMAKRLNNAF